MAVFRVLLPSNYCTIVVMMALAFLLMHWKQPMVLAAEEGPGEWGVAAARGDIEPPFIQISKSKMKRLLDILKARSRQHSEGQEDPVPYSVNEIRDAIVPITLNYIRQQRPLSENRDIVGWERLGWGWK